MQKRWLAAVGILGLAAASVAWSLLSGDSVLTQLPERVRRAVTDPQEVTAQRIRSTADGSLQTTGKPVLLTTEQVAELRSLFGKKGATVGVPACTPHPGIRFRFPNGSKVVKADICLACARAFFQEEGGQNSDAANFDHVKPQMVEFVKRVFIDDPEIQRLEPHGTPEFERP